MCSVYNPDLVNRRVFIGLGANLGEPLKTFDSAIRALGNYVSGVQVIAVSSAFRSRALVRNDAANCSQPDYCNAVIETRVDLEPSALLRGLQELEVAAGRQLGGDMWGPRTLDLDLLLFGDLQQNTQGLVLPHPGIREREFVLEPLNQLAPDFRLPPDGTLVDKVLARLRLRTAKPLDVSGGEILESRNDWLSLV